MKLIGKSSIKEKEMRKSKICILLLAVSFLLLSGCVMGNKYMYHGLNLDLKNEGSAKIAVVTYDQRPYIVSGNKKPNFVGFQRGGMGHPFKVTTASGNSLAEDITDTITRSLKSNGFDSIGVVAVHSDSYENIKASLKRENTPRSIVTTLYEWGSDSHDKLMKPMSTEAIALFDPHIDKGRLRMHKIRTPDRTSLVYDVRIQVLNADGNIIGEKKISGVDSLGGSFWDPIGHAKKAVSAAFVQKFNTLLNSKEISDTLIGVSNKISTKSRSGQLDRSVSNYETAVQVNPNDASAYVKRGNTYYRSRQHQKAISEYSKAIKLDPNYVSAYYNRGNAYASLRRFGQAKKDLLKAVELKPALKPNVMKSSNTYKLDLKFD